MPDTPPRPGSADFQLETLTKQKSVACQAEEATPAPATDSLLGQAKQGSSRQMTPLEAVLPLEELPAHMHKIEASLQALLGESEAGGGTFEDSEADEDGSEDSEADEDAPLDSEADGSFCRESEVFGLEDSDDKSHAQKKQLYLDVNALWTWQT